MSEETPISSEQESCFNCPNFVPPDDTLRAFATYFESGGCMAKAIPIHTKSEKTDEERTVAAIEQRKGCTAYGNLHSFKTNKTRGSSEVMFLINPEKYPMTGLINRFPTRETINDVFLAGDVTKVRKAHDCESCAFFVPEWATDEAHDLRVNVCAQKNEILLDKNHAKDGENCDHSVNRYDYDQALPAVDIPDDYWSAIPTAQDLSLTPKYLTVRIMNAEDGPAILRLERTKDPRETVLKGAIHTEEFRKETGILGYNKVTNKARPFIIRNGKKVPNEIVYPVYDREWEGFTALEKSKIPHPSKQMVDLYHDQNDRLLWFVLDSWNTTDQVPFLQGTPGTGKTAAFEYVAWKLQLPLHEFSCNEGMTTENFIGMTGVVNDEGVPITKFAAQAWAAFWPRPAVILGDEYSLLPTDVMTSLRAFLDGKKINPEEAPNLTIERHNDAFLGLTGNYFFDEGSHNVSPLADPEKSRVKGYHVEELDEATEKMIVVTACNARNDYEITKGTLKNVFRIAQDIRNATRPEVATLPGVFPLRQIVNLAISTQTNTMRQAVHGCFSIDLDPDQRRLLDEIVSQHGEVVEREVN